MNSEGILTVTAIDKDTKSEKVVQIENALDYEPEEIEKMKEIALKFSYEDQQILEKRENLVILENEYELAACGSREPSASEAPIDAGFSTFSFSSVSL